MPGGVSMLELQLAYLIAGDLVKRFDCVTIVRIMTCLEEHASWYLLVRCFF